MRKVWPLASTDAQPRLKHFLEGASAVRAVSVGGSSWCRSRGYLRRCMNEASLSNDVDFRRARTSDISASYILCIIHD